MELGLTLVAPAGGTRADVVVRAQEGTCLAEVLPALLTRVLDPGQPGELRAGGHAIPATAVLGTRPLVHGALLEVSARSARSAGADVQGIAELPGGGGAHGARALPTGTAPLRELHVVSGPDAGAVHALPLGALVVGRGGSADVRLDDPDVSRRHCRLQVSPEAVHVDDLGSANGTTVDGAVADTARTTPATGTGELLAPGAVLHVGRSRLLVASAPVPAVPLRPAQGGRSTFNRPPRLREPHVPVQVVVPAPPTERERTPLPVLAVLAPLVLGLVLWRTTGSTAYLLITLLSPILVVAGVVTERRSGRRTRRAERALWRARRDVAEAALATAVRDDERARRSDSPDPVEVVRTATGPGPGLWQRRRDDDDAVCLRLGLADQPARVEAEGDVPTGATTARAVPVVVPLRSAGVLGVAGPASPARALVRWLVVQAAVWHSPRDLSIVVLAEPSAAREWEWAAWLPHTRPGDGQDCRALLGLSPEQAAVRVRELNALVALRSTSERSTSERSTSGRTTQVGPSSGTPPVADVLLVVDGALALRGVPGLAALLADGPRVGVHAVCLDADPRLLPAEAGATAVLGAGGGLQVRCTGRPDVDGATPDLLSTARAEVAARSLAPVTDDSRDGADALPGSVRWAQLAGVALEAGPRDVDRVVERWAAGGRSSTVLLGQAADGPYSVDLVRDGPHALVTGTTGSGKSELLQALVASLALVNRPDELSLVLVDYKGGAAFGPCARLPHVAGLVTDLDGALVERALTSLRAELARREAVLLSHGAKDVAELHRRVAPGPGGPPLPRLVLVVDEFAALAAELPDFVGGLVDLAARGRSLGVHLVLATQRPEGVVSPAIRANTALRLCLAVTGEPESRDVLDSPLAARLGRGTPGRTYARTGPGELTLFQAARVGGRRPAARSGAAGPTVEVLPASVLGDPLPAPAPGPLTHAADEVSDLSLLVDACAGAASRLRLPPARSPWLPPLPDRLRLDDLPAVEDPRGGPPGRVPPLAYGLLDVPERQARQVLALDLDHDGHLLVVGSPRSGRTTVLRALAGSVASGAGPGDVHLYALDLGGGGLVALETLPHTGAVVLPDQPERTARLLSWLASEVSRRQAALAAAGHADLAAQRAAAAPSERLPHLVLLIDRWEAFLGAYQDLDGGRLVDLVLRLLQEGTAAGLHLVVTADRSGLVGRIGTLVPDRLLLRLADRGDYAGAGRPSRLVPAAVPPGRGWALQHPPLTAQVALLDDDPSADAQAAALVARVPPTGHQVAASRRPRRVDALPSAVTRSSLPAPPAGFLLVGAGGDEPGVAALARSDVGTGLLVAGPPGSGRSTALLILAEGLAETGLAVVAVAPRRSPLRALPGCVQDSCAVDELEHRLAAGPVALVVDDAELLLDAPLAPVLERAVRRARDTGSVVIAGGTTDDLLVAYRGFVVDLRRSRTGVLLSPQSAADGDLLGLRLSRAAGGEVLPGRGLLVVRGRARPVQVAQPG